MRHAFGVCMVLVLAGSLCAAVGDLTPVAVEADPAMSDVSFVGQHDSFAKRKAGDGTVNEHAMITTLRRSDGARGMGFSVKVAIDSRSADAKSPDVIRFDWTGKGKFGDNLVPLKALTTKGSFNARVGPATVEATIGGKTFPVHVAGSYYKSGTFRYIRLRFGTGLEGSCRFGDKVLRVRIVDGNGNLRCGDPALPNVKSGKPRGILPGDLLRIDGGKGAQTVFYGQRVQVDGTWYAVKVAHEKRKIAAAAVDVKTGRVRVRHEKWSATLVGTNHLLKLSGGSEAIDVPVDQYVVVDYDERRPEANDQARLVCYGREARLGRAKLFDVAAGKVTELAIGSQLIGSVKVSTVGRTRRLSLVLTDQSGATVGSLSASNGRRPPAPQVKIYDSSGAIVHTGKMEYG